MCTEQIADYQTASDRSEPSSDTELHQLDHRRYETQCGNNSDTRLTNRGILPHVEIQAEASKQLDLPASVDAHKEQTRNRFRQEQAKAEREAIAIQKATDTITREAYLRWGKDNVHVSGRDPIESAAVLVFGQEYYDQRPHLTKAIVREALVFGVGSVDGFSEEAKNKDPGELLLRGLKNCACSAIINAVIRMFPYMGLLTGVASTGMWLNKEFGPANAERNREIRNLSLKVAGDRDVYDLRNFTKQAAHLTGKEAFDTVFDVATSGVGEKLKPTFR